MNTITQENGVIFSADNKTLVSVPKDFLPQAPPETSDGEEKQLVRYIVPEGTVIISDKAFKGCSNLEEIIIPEGVTHIGGGAFIGCRNLQKITLPNSLVSLGDDSTFCMCESLQSIMIPPKVSVIPPFCFKRCKSLETVLLPPTITIIGDYAFTFCKSLTNIQFYLATPENIVVSGNAFLFCPYRKPQRNIFITFLLKLIYLPLALAGYLVTIFGFINLANVILRLCSAPFRLKYAAADAGATESLLLLVCGLFIFAVSIFWKKYWKL